MTHVNKSFRLPGWHLRYVCHICCAIHRTLLLCSLNDCPVPDELFLDNILEPLDARLHHVMRKDFDYWLRQLPLDKSPGDAMINSPRWWNGARSACRDERCTLLGSKSGNTGRKDANINDHGRQHPPRPSRKGLSRENLSINMSMYLMNTAAKTVTSVL